MRSIMLSANLFLLLLFLVLVTGRKQVDAFHTPSKPLRSVDGKKSLSLRSPLDVSAKPYSVTSGMPVRDFSVLASTAAVNTDSASASTSLDPKVLLAKALGYVMAAGAMFIYTPILFKLIKQGNGEGFSLATFIFNLTGLSLAMAYPMKKGFPLSTYLELVWAAIQSAMILGLLCFYQNRVKEFILGVTVLVSLFTWFKRTANFPAKYLNLIQISASLFANYANIPQIILTFRTQKASWSGITATLSLAGCLIRIFTTLQLTKDKLVVAGYSLGAITNGILLLQVLIFRK